MNLFQINRDSLLKLLFQGELDLIPIRDVTSEVLQMFLKNRWKDNDVFYIITGSYAASLVGVTLEYNDIDIFTDNKKVIPCEKKGKIEVVLKEGWQSVFDINMRCTNLMFASLIIHLFDLDCCRFTCIPEDTGSRRKWMLYTCSAGLRFLSERKNYVDMYNARSLKVHVRTLKYKERGIESEYLLPDQLNLSTDIYGGKLPQRDDGIIIDNRDLYWFITQQHGIELPGRNMHKWYRDYISDKKRGIDRRELVIRTINAMNDSFLQMKEYIEDRDYVPFINWMPEIKLILGLLSEELLDAVESMIAKRGIKRDIQYDYDTLKVLNKFKYLNDNKYYLPFEHKKKIYWILITYADEKISDIKFYAYESYKNYKLRYKGYLEMNIDVVISTLKGCPIPDKAKDREIDKLYTMDQESDNDSDDSDQSE